MNFIPFSNKENTYLFQRLVSPSSTLAIVVQFFLSCGVGYAGMYSTLLKQLNLEMDGTEDL